MKTPVVIVQVGKGVCFAAVQPPLEREVTKHKATLSESTNHLSAITRIYVSQGWMAHEFTHHPIPRGKAEEEIQTPAQGEEEDDKKPKLPKDKDKLLEILNKMRPLKKEEA